MKNIEKIYNSICYNRQSKYEIKSERFVYSGPTSPLQLRGGRTRVGFDRSGLGVVLGTFPLILCVLESAVAVDLDVGGLGVGARVDDAVDFDLPLGSPMTSPEAAALQMSFIKSSLTVNF